VTATRYVALLRGINVGRAKRIAMQDLRALLERLGYGDVRTLLNSGNAVFTGSGTARQHEQRIEEALATEVGVPVRVIVLSGRDVATVMKENPFTDSDVHPSRLLVAILAAPADRERLLPLTREDWGPDSFAVGSRAGYLWCAGGILESRLPAAVDRLVKDRVTARNWATIGKIAALTGSPTPAGR
jgi:uncharacterized protein (DUF1697 family)